MPSAPHVGVAAEAIEAMNFRGTYASLGSTEGVPVPHNVTRILASARPLKSSLVTTATIQPDDRDENE